MSAKSRSKELQKQAQKLSAENDAMERRLLELKSSLRKQREQRHAKGGYQWKSGGRGSLSSHAQGVREKASTRAGRQSSTSALSSTGHRHRPHPPPSSTLPASVTPHAPTNGSRGSRGHPHSGHSKRAPNHHGRRIMPHPPSAPRTAEKGSGVKEGRVSATVATALVADAVEQSLQKKRQSESNVRYEGMYDEAQAQRDFRAAVEEWRRGTATTADSLPQTSSSSTHDDLMHPPEPEEGGGKLLQGPAFDEGESHASFKEAVAQWREQRQAQKESDESKRNKTWSHDAAVVNAVTSSEIQADSPLPKAMTPTIEFESNLTYLEKLMLKKSRSTPTGSRSQSRADDDRTRPPHASSSVATIHEELLNAGDDDGDDDDDDDVLPLGDHPIGDDDGVAGYEDVDDDDALLRQIASLQIKGNANGNITAGDDTATYSIVELGDDAHAGNGDVDGDVEESDANGGPLVDEPSDTESEPDTGRADGTLLNRSLNASFSERVGETATATTTITDAIDDLLGRTSS